MSNMAEADELFQVSSMSLWVMADSPGSPSNFCHHAVMISKVSDLFWRQLDRLEPKWAPSILTAPSF